MIIVLSRSNGLILSVLLGRNARPGRKLMVLICRPQLGRDAPQPLSVLFGFSHCRHILLHPLDEIGYRGSLDQPALSDFDEFQFASAKVVVD